MNFREAIAVSTQFWTYSAVLIRSAEIIRGGGQPNSSIIKEKHAGSPKKQTTLVLAEDF